MSLYSFPLYIFVFLSIFFFVCWIFVIFSKFFCFMNQEKARVERSTWKFWQTFLSNSIPTIHSYIDEAHRCFGPKIPSKQNKSDELTKFHSLPNMNSSNTTSHPCSCKLETENHPVLELFLSSIDFIDFPGPHIYPGYPNG